MAPKKRPLGAGDDDEAFPRGGSDGLTALERREVLVEAEKEVERELALGSQPGKKKTKGGKRGDDGEVRAAGAGLAHAAAHVRCMCDGRHGPECVQHMVCVSRLQEQPQPT